MKPPAFTYHRPASVEDALAVLAEVGEDGKVLAGGQSLVPMLNMRLAAPGHLVDINRLETLSYVRHDGASNTIRIGALARHAAVERDVDAYAVLPLLRQATANVAHPAIRNRGTVGGSVAHADPAAELPVALTALDARFHVRSARRGTRTIAAADFFHAPLMTALAPDELLVEIEVPPLPAGARTGFAEHARTHGDFAVAGAAVVRAGAEHAAVALLGAGPTPVRAHDAERAVRRGASPAEAGRIAGAALDDDWRRALTAELVRRALEEASA